MKLVKGEKYRSISGKVWEIIGTADDTLLNQLNSEDLGENIAIGRSEAGALRLFRADTGKVIGDNPGLNLEKTMDLQDIQFYGLYDEIVVEELPDEPRPGDYWVSLITKGEKKGQWKVVKEGFKKKPVIFKTQKEAWAIAKAYAHKDEVEAFLKDRNGKIRERNSYGNDPRNIPG